MDDTQKYVDDTQKYEDKLSASLGRPDWLANIGLAWLADIGLLRLAARHWTGLAGRHLVTESNFKFHRFLKL